MNLNRGGDTAEWTPQTEFETPFAEAYPAEIAVERASSAREVGEAGLQGLSPFADEASDGFAVEAEADGLVSEALAELQDEDFHEALASLADATEAAVGERFGGEIAPDGGQRERFAQAYLAGVQFEAEQYLTTLETELANLDLAGLTAEQLDEVLDRFDPPAGELAPEGEEFIGKLVKKAKNAARFVVSAAKQAGKLAAPLLGPVLGRLRKLVAPLLRRVLALAIGRLPAPLQPAARQLADRVFRARSAPREALEHEELEMAPAVEFDVEALADSFDLRLAEAMAFPDAAVGEAEGLASDGEDSVESRELDRLAEARGALIDGFLEAGDRQDMAPTIEQFVPVLLGALKIGIRLVGRPKVVRVLSGYLAQSIRRWVGPEAARPLASAIVDTGLKLISLEAEGEAAGLLREAAPGALASVVEDAVRRFAENEDYVFEDEDLTQVALGEALSEAVATHFPQDQVRGELQMAPSLGGTFIARGPRTFRSYAKYSRVPQIEISARAADALPGFGGATLGAAHRASGGSFPLRARMHIYQARPGSTVASLLRHDRRGTPAAARVYPLTPQAAGVLLREPGLGAAVPARFLSSRNRIAAGQRLYVLEPLGGAMPAGAAAQRLAPGRVWLAVNQARARITLGFYLSEMEAQSVAEAIRQGRGHAMVLRALVVGFKRLARPPIEAVGPSGAVREDGEDLEDFAARAGRSLPHGFRRLLLRRIAAWALPAIAAWLRGNADAFVRAAADPQPGVTLRVRLSGVPGLAGLGRGAVPSLAMLTQAMRGKPAVTVSAGSGKGR